MINVFLTERNLHKYRYDFDEIVRILNSKRISGTAFARKIGLRADTFNRMIARRAQHIKLDLLDKMAVELDVPMEQIVKKKDSYEPRVASFCDGTTVNRKVCPMCGEEFYTAKTGQVYCCSKCKDMEYRRKKNEKV